MPNDGNTKEKRRQGAQPGNTNARKWTEEKLIKLGKDLITWLNEKERHVFFKTFLLKHGLYSDLLADQESGCALFAELLKKARAIQETKLMELTAFNKINTGLGIFLLKSIHGHTDRSEQTVIDQTVKVRVNHPRPSATEEAKQEVEKLVDSLKTNKQLPTSEPPSKE